MTPPRAKTSVEHWNSLWSTPPRMRLPLPLNVAVVDLQKLLRRYATPGARCLEIGCAPGKMLAWAGKVLRLEVSGLDYSRRGIDHARALFDHLGLQGDLRCEDIFDSSLEPGRFDLVYSVGVIEHFDDPRAIVRQHARFLKPGGVAVITIPHYGRVYGRLQRHFDPANLGIHNLAIMTPRALEELVPLDIPLVARAFPAGRLSPWIISFERRWPRPIATMVKYAINTLGLLQPRPFPGLHSLLVLEITRTAERGP